MNPFRKAWNKVPKRLRAKRYIFSIIAIAAVLFYTTRGGADTSKIKTTQVARKDIESQVSASGEIKSETSGNLYFGTSGKIIWIGVKKGDHVTSGQTLAYLDSSQYTAALRQAQMDVTNADAVLSQVYDEQKKQTQAENYDQKIRRTAAETAKNKAFDSVKVAQSNLANTVMTAPADGTITEVDVVAGQEVLVSTQIAKIADLQNISFVAQVDETDIGKVLTGQEAAVTLDAFPDNPITSSVQEVAPSSTITSTGSTAYETKITIPQDSKYKIGLNGQVQITTQKETGALVIPLEALVDDQYVYVKKGTQFVKENLQKGISSDTEIQITSPLSQGDQIVTAGFEEIGKKTLLQKLLHL